MPGPLPTRPRRFAPVAVLFGLLAASACARTTALPPASAPPPPVADSEHPPAPKPSDIEGYAGAVKRALRVRHPMRLLHRMGIARLGPVRLRPDGPPQGWANGMTLAPFVRAGVVEDGTRPRVLVDQAGVRLLLYVERDDAMPVVQADTLLRPRPGMQVGPLPDEGMAVLRKGAWVRLEQRRGEELQVRHREVGSGYVDAAALGVTVEFDGEPSRLERGQPRKAGRATELRVSPDGRALKSIADQRELRVFPEHTRDGHTLVYEEATCDRYGFVGFVATQDIGGPWQAYLLGCPYYREKLSPHWGDAWSEPRTTIEAGRFLLDPQEPTIVGCAAEEVPAADLGDGRVALPTVWGPITVRLAPAEFEGRCSDGE